MLWCLCTALSLPLSLAEGCKLWKRWSYAFWTATVHIIVLNINNQDTCTQGLLAWCPGLAYHDTDPGQGLVAVM